MSTESKRVVRFEWKDHGEGLYNPDFTGYTIAPAYTGHPELGWCLYSKDGACWNQRTQTEKPPWPGAEPRRVDGKWVWADPRDDRTMGDEEFNELLKGPLHHPLAMFTSSAW